MIGALASVYGAIPKWLLLVALSGLALRSCSVDAELDRTSAELSTEKQGRATDLANYETERAQASLELAASQAAHRAAEATLQASFDQERKKANDQIQTHRAAADLLRERLRITTEAAGPAAASYSIATAPAAARPFAPGSLGAILRGQAEFLAGEAARADTIRVALNQCYASHDAARVALERLKAQDPSTKPGRMAQ